MPKSGAWFAAIADTGQKHVLPWTPMNFAGHGGSRGTVRFEEQNVRLGSFDLVDAMCGLLTAGATKDELASGHYTPRAWQLAQSEIEAFEESHGRPLRGGAWFSLSVWLAQRDEEAVQARMAAEKEQRAAKTERAKEDKGADKRTKGGPARADTGLPARSASGLPGGGHEAGAEALDADRERGEGRRVARQKDSKSLGGKGNGKAQRASFVQIDLFGD